MKVGIKAKKSIKVTFLLYLFLAVLLGLSSSGMGVLSIGIAFLFFMYLYIFLFLGVIISSKLVATDFKHLILLLLPIISSLPSFISMLRAPYVEGSYGFGGVPTGIVALMYLVFIVPLSLAIAIYLLIGQINDSK